jgi:hypothetical protein
MGNEERALTEVDGDDFGVERVSLEASVGLIAVRGRGRPSYCACIA